MDAPQYVHDDVISSYLFYWTFYYTHHSDVGASRYVHVDVISSYSFYWMSCYTHHTDMYVPQYVSPVERKKGVTLLFLKSGTKHNKMQVTNQLHK